MNNGGFDVVIGNPPYVFAREKVENKDKEYYSKKYYSAEYQINTFVLFIEKSIKLLKNNDYLGFIVPNTLLQISSISKLREYILNNSSIKKIINLYGYSFKGVDVETVIFIIQKGQKTNEVQALNIYEKDKGNDLINKEYKIISALGWECNEYKEFNIFVSEKESIILEKIINKSKPLETFFDVKAGLQAYEKGKGNPKQTENDVKNRPYDFFKKVDANTYPYLA